MSNAKPEHYTYTRAGNGKTASTVTRDVDGAALGTVVRIRRLGGGHMWQALPPHCEAGDGRMVYQPKKLDAARYLDALARVEARTYDVWDEVVYDTGQGYSQTASVIEVLPNGLIHITGHPSRIRLADIAKAMMKNLDD